MVLLLVHQSAQQQRQRRIRRQQQMERRRGNRSLQHDQTHILDRAVHRVNQEQPLDRRRVAVHRVEDRRHVHQQHREHVVQVRNIPEEHEQRRQNQAHADVEDHQAEDRIEDRDEFRRERHAVNGRKQEEHQQRQAEVDDCRNVLRQQEHVFGHVDLREDVRIAHQRVHAAGCRLAVIREHQVAREQVRRVVRHISAEELGEHQAHDQQGQKRRQNAPPHAQHRALVLLLEVALDEFLEEELVPLHPR